MTPQKRSLQSGKGTPDGTGTSDVGRETLLATEYDTMQCSDCGALFEGGKWIWCDRTPARTPTTRCPACTRSSTRQPAGELRLTGAFVDANTPDIEAIIHRVIASNLSRDPMDRPMQVSSGEDGIMVTTTATHLAGAIAEAVDAAYNGTVEAVFEPGDAHVSIFWCRAIRDDSHVV